MNWSLLKNSLLVSTQTTVCAVVLGFLAAIWAAGLEKRWRNIVLVLGIASFGLPPFLVTNCWLHLLGNAGVWSKWLPLNIISFGGTTWLLTLLTWPVAFCFVLAAFRKIERSYFEVEPMMRGSALIRFLLLPMARNELLLAAVITFVLALNNFSIPVILQTRIFPEELWLSFNTTFDYAAALKLSWPLVLAPLTLLFLFRHRNISWLWKSEGVSAKIFRQQLGNGWFYSGAICGLAMLILSLGFPLVQLVFAGRTWTDFIPALVASKSAIVYSFVFAAITASIVIAVGLLTSRWRIGFVAWTTFLIPGVLLGIALIWLLNRPGLLALYQSIGAVVIALAIRYLAPGWNAVGAALRQTDRNLNEVAELEGANRWQLFWHVQRPQILPQLCAAWYVVYLFCLWDVETLVFIVPPGIETISLRVFNLLHYGHNSHVNALCLVALVLAILPLVVWTALSQSTKHEKPKTNQPGSGWCLEVIWCLVFGVWCFSSGCSVSNGKPAEKQFPVQSQFFSHVEIIGRLGTAPGQFNKPRSLELDAHDNLFVVDMTGRVQKFSPSGVYVLSWQMPQTDLGKAKGMSRDKDGNVIVVEPHYQRVNHFSSDGKLIMQWGTKGTNTGELVLPRAAAVNARGDILLTEYTTVDRVQAFSASGKWLFAFGQQGNKDSEFNRAEGIGVDTQNRIYVADSCNHRIQVFGSDGKFLRSYGKAGDGKGQINYPYDVRVDAAGRQYVCEFGNSRIQIFDPNDQSIEILGKPGAAPGEFANPWSIALDSKGNLYVADSRNHRVQKFVRKKEQHRTSNIERRTSNVLRESHFTRRSMFDVQCSMFPISK